MTRKNKPHRTGCRIRSYRVTADGKVYVKYQISVPPAVAELIPRGTKFTVELTEEGILFRRVVPKPESVPDPLPSWTKKDGGVA